MSDEHVFFVALHFTTGVDFLTLLTFVLNRLQNLLDSFLISFHFVSPRHLLFVEVMLHIVLFFYC